MGVVSLIEALMGTKVDTSGFETGVQKIEKLSEDLGKKITEHFGIIGVTIASAIAGTVLVAMEKAIKATAEWGLEIEHLSNRMGMTTKETATLVSMMERFGISSGVAARALQMLSVSVKNTQDSLDPFATRIGKTLGSLRDSNGQALNLAQVLDLLRQKVSGAGTETERLQIATSVLGARMGGQLVPLLKLSNEEWEKQRKNVEENLGPIEKAAEQALQYKQATAELEQAFRELQLELGTKLLPTLIDIVHAFSSWMEGIKKGESYVPILSDFVAVFKDIKGLIEQTTYAYLWWAEKLGIVEKGSAETFVNMKKIQDEARKAAVEHEKLADASERAAAEIELTEQKERQLVQLVKERVQLAEKAQKLGMGNWAEVQSALSEALQKLQEQRSKLEEELSGNLTPDQRLKIETEISKNKVAAAELVSKITLDMLEDQEKRLKVARELGLRTIEDEIEFRKKKSAELLGKGDVIGAAGEIVKARDLSLKAADEVFQFTKKIRVVSIQNEIDFQKQKLEIIKGNAEEERKILSNIADLDKQLYERRLETSLDYTKNVVDAYQRVMDAAKKAGNVETFERARIDSERNLVEATREAGGVLRGGGTKEQREAAVGFAQFVYKQVEQMQTLGQTVSGIWKDAADTARDILKAASGGEEVRAPGGPSPTIGSLLSPAEGLSTSGLARGSDIPRLDTSFTDLAIRVRDVLLNSVTYIQNFGDVVASVNRKIAAITGQQLNPGAIGPGGGVTTLPTQGSGQPSTGTQVATTAPGSSPVQPSPQIGVASAVPNQSLITVFSDLKKSVEDGNRELREALQTISAANSESLANALSQVQAARQKVDVSVSLDANTGDLIVSRILQELS